MRRYLWILLAACGSSEPASTTVPATVPTPVASTQTVSPGIELAEVASTGFDRADKLVPHVAVSPTSLTIRGREVVALKDGNVSAADVEGGAVGRLIPKLREQAAGLADKRVVIQIDRRVPFQTMNRVIETLSKAGVRELTLLARSGANVVSAPVRYPASDFVRPGSDRQLVVSLASDELKLWSLSGRDGTLEAPRLSMKTNPGIDLAQLGAVLAEIRARDASGGRSIILIADWGIAAQTILEVIGAVRATPDGISLYPEVLLSLDTN